MLKESQLCPFKLAEDKIMKLSRKMISRGLVFLTALLILTIFFTSLAPTQQAVIVFSGQPTHKVSEGGIERLPEKLERAKANEFQCVIANGMKQRQFNGPMKLHVLMKFVEVNKRVPTYDEIIPVETVTK